MNLRDYLKQEKITQRAFGLMTKLDKRTIIRIVAGHMTDIETALIIEYVTKGAVKVADLCPYTLEELLKKKVKAQKSRRNKTKNTKDR